MRPIPLQLAGGLVGCSAMCITPPPFRLLLAGTLNAPLLSLQRHRERAMIEALSEGGKNGERRREWID